MTPQTMPSPTNEAPANPQPEARISVEVVQSLFDLLVPLSSSLRDKCLALGFDPKKLSPTYSLDGFSELLLAVARERFADRPLEQALDRLGRENVLAMQKRHIWLSAMLPMMRLLGPHRVMSKANARRIGQTNTELTYTTTGPTEGELKIHPCPLPAFLGGVVAQVVANAGGLDARCDLIAQSGAAATLRVSWKPS